MVCFPGPIILAIMLNEIREKWLKKSIQSIVYLPHFLFDVRGTTVSVWALLLALLLLTTIQGRFP